MVRVELYSDAKLQVRRVQGPAPMWYLPPPSPDRARERTSPNLPPNPALTHCALDCTPDDSRRNRDTTPRCRSRRNHPRSLPTLA
jgi:hypothetical protein